MESAKLTVRVPRELIIIAKQYAETHNTTLTRMIEAYLQQIPARKPLDNAPIVRRLTGIIPPGDSIEDYKRHLDEKYGG